MEQYTHSCIKCGSQYQDIDPDPYYCPVCVIEKNKIAKEVDSKVHISRKQVKSDLQIFDEIRKARGVNFVSIKDLGITL